MEKNLNEGVNVRKQRKSYEIQVDSGSGGWFWRLVSQFNGKTMAHSECYTNKGAAMKSARRVKADLNNSILMFKMKNGDWFIEG